MERIVDTSQPLWRQILRTGVAGALVLLLIGASSGPASAHSFSLAIYTNGAGDPAMLRAAVRGILTASAENDGHRDETADGHLGGLDVFVIPLPTASADQIDGLVDHETESFDFLVLLAPMPADLLTLEGGASQTIVLDQGDPVTWLESPTSEVKSFAVRYRDRFGEPPNAYAAQGYYAARRIDHALRETNGLSNPEETRKALNTSRQGVDW